MSRMLYSNQPGTGFYDSFPLGNGTLGDMIAGQTGKEVITLNHIGLWSGEEKDCFNPAAKEAIPEIRRLFFAGEYEAADELARKALCRPSDWGDGDSSRTSFGAYLPLKKTYDIKKNGKPEYFKNFTK